MCGLICLLEALVLLEKVPNAKRVPREARRVVFTALSEVEVPRHEMQGALWDTVEGSDLVRFRL